MCVNIYVCVHAGIYPCMYTCLLLSSSVAELIEMTEVSMCMCWPLN